MLADAPYNGRSSCDHEKSEHDRISVDDIKAMVELYRADLKPGENGHFLYVTAV